MIFIKSQSLTQYFKKIENKNTYFSLIILISMILPHIIQQNNHRNSQNKQTKQIQYFWDPLGTRTCVTQSLRLIIVLEVSIPKNVIHLLSKHIKHEVPFYTLFLSLKFMESFVVLYNESNFPKRFVFLKAYNFHHRKPLPSLSRHNTLRNLESNTRRPEAEPKQYPYISFTLLTKQLKQKL